jgi:hypothetical protein
MIDTSDDIIHPDYIRIIERKREEAESVKPKLLEIGIGRRDPN